MRATGNSTPPWVTPLTELRLRYDTATRWISPWREPSREFHCTSPETSVARVRNLRAHFAAILMPMGQSGLFDLRSPHLGGHRSGAHFVAAGSSCAGH